MILRSRVLSAPIRSSDFGTGALMNAILSLISYENDLARLFTSHFIILLLSSDGFYYYKHLNHTDNLQRVPISFKLAFV